MATLKSIAQKAGVSVAAVSATLSGRHGTICVAESTRKRIIGVAEEAGYRPNPLASSLRTGRTGNIGICLREPERYLSHPHGARNFWNMCKLADRHGYRLNLSVSDVSELDARTMDGCLVLTEVMEPHLEKSLKRLADDIPVVCLYQDFPWAVSVVEDLSWHVERRRAAEYLFDMGHRNIAVVHFDRPSQEAIPSMFRQVVKERDLDVTIRSVKQMQFDRRYLSIEKVLTLDPLPTAIFAIDDDYARSLISQLWRRGVRVPERVSVFSGSTLPNQDWVWPGLTGFCIHFEKEWEGLINGFVELIEGKRQAEPFLLSPLEVELIERDSCVSPSE